MARIVPPTHTHEGLHSGPPMYRRGASIVAAAITVGAILPACRDEDGGRVVLAVSNEARVPDDVDALEILVERGGASRFAQRYVLQRGQPLPGTLAVENESVSRDPVTVTVRVQRSDQPGTWRITRKARFSFAKEKTKLLRLPLRYVCLDVVCEADATCIGGVCGSPDVDVDALPDFGSNEEVLGPPEGVKDTTCFDAEACLSGAMEVAVDGCTFVPGAAAGSFNVGLRWKAAALTVVLEPDPQEGYSATSELVTLSSGACAAVTSGDASVVVSTACPS
jgi:hypothetical protein